MKKALCLPSAVFLTSVVIYWFNLDNKVIYYGIRPILNKHYDSQERDIRI